jgi:LmbE family N-acetylglucosaminyl deacetylase
MQSLTVLSPHQDDAALSLAGAIGAASRRGRPVRIVNCFTVSAYAPHSEARDTAEVGAVRRAEDREFASRVGQSVDVVDLGMEDAPIRLGRPIHEVRRRRIGRVEHAQAGQLAEAAARLAAGTVLAPLGLGRHIDHLIARDAGIRLARAGRTVIFYEDLPYAAELRECCILRAADGVSRRLGLRLAGAVVQDGAATARKRYAIEAYRSQLSPTQFDAVIRYGARLGGERVWGGKGLEESIPAVEFAGIETGSISAAWQRRIHCATHTAASRARAICRRATAWSLGGGLDAPQTN